MKECGFSDSVSLRDARYSHVVHMLTAARGAESFYQLSNNHTRSEGLDLARELDAKAANVNAVEPLPISSLPLGNEL